MRCTPLGSGFCRHANLAALLALCVAVTHEPHPATAQSLPETPPVVEAALLPPGPGNPRNSEGDFLQLADGRILFIYTHYYDGRGGDHDQAFLGGRISSDGGLTWPEASFFEALPNEGQMNVMSVSLLRLADDRIALLYLRKNSLQDCRPYVRFSTDEAATWSAPVEVVPDSEMGYYVVNNDRLVQLASGRLVIPVAQHCGYEMQPDWDRRGRISCYLSDDGGRTWRRSQQSFYAQDPHGNAIQTQEPGVVELRDGRLLMFIRTDAGAQYVCHSSDGGETWSEPAPGPLASPLSPASIKAIPQTNHLLAVWNDVSRADADRTQHRTPLTVAISEDDGRTWSHRRDLETDPDGHYCYTAIHFADGRVLLAYCAGSRTARRGLATTKIASIDVGWLYEAE